MARSYLKMDLELNYYHLGIGFDHGQSIETIKNHVHLNEVQKSKMDATVILAQVNVWRSQMALSDVLRVNMKAARYIFDPGLLHEIV